MTDPISVERLTWEYQELVRAVCYLRNAQRDYRRIPCPSTERELRKAEAVVDKFLDTPTQKSLF